jgi:hypothetical protein
MNNDKIAKIINLETVIFEMRQKDEIVPDNLLVNLNKMYNNVSDEELEYIKKTLKVKLVEDYDEILIKVK